MMSWLNPTVMSLLCGVNDANRSAVSSPEDFDLTVRKLLTETKEKFPGIRLILGEPFAFLLENYRDEEHKKQIEHLYAPTQEIAGYAKKIAQDFDALFIPYGDTLKKYIDRAPEGYIVWDGVHPTYAGHQIMADLWYKVTNEAGLFCG